MRHPPSLPPFGADADALERYAREWKAWRRELAAIQIILGCCMLAMAAALLAVVCMFT